MQRPPDDDWITLAQKILVKLVLPLVAFALGTWIVYQDASVHPPADTTTSTFGVLLMGYLPVQGIDIFERVLGARKQ